MLLRSDLNKLRLTQFTKLYNLYINAASNRILQRYKTYYIEYKNQFFPKKSHINLRACDAVSLYNFPYPISGSKIPKWDCILKCCADFPGTNVSDLESSKRLDRLFPGSLNKIKIHIFKNIFKCSICGLIPFKYKNICELCDLTQEKYKGGNIMVKKHFFFMRKLFIYFIINYIFQ